MFPIYVDIDDVLADTSSCLIHIAEKEFRKKVPFEELTSFDLKVSFDLTQHEYEHFLEMAHQPDEILNIAPIPDAIMALRQWMASGYEISIVTGRPTTTYETTLDWLAAHNVPHDHFFMVNKYARPGMDESIALSMQALSEMKFQFAIEDSYDMAVHLADNMDTQVLLYDRPWNRGPALNGKIRRFQNWDELQGKT
ncbi:MAG: bifunctional metallophosphatase/5'-nucleotidase [Thermodesulfobacteriota bacterium]